MKKIFEKYPILRYVIGSYAKNLIFAVIFFLVVFAVLKFSGMYAQIERTLDLKYDSYFVLIPLYGSAVLAVLCFVIGILMYFHKYKRSKTKSVFNRTFTGILSGK